MKKTDLYYPDHTILSVLQQVSTIAIVGISNSWKRPSNFVMNYMQKKGYRVLPINPKYTGSTILNEKVYSSLSECSEPVDMVDIFRPNNEIPNIAKEAVENKDRLGIKVFWMQLGLINMEAHQITLDSGMTVIMNRCPKIEFGRLSGELGWGGVNTGVVTAKRYGLLKK